MTIEIIKELAELPHETEWCEFKHNYDDFESIGETISAIANSCLLHGRSKGYIVWGIDDKTHELIGTIFNPKQTKHGNEEIENWWNRNLYPALHFQIHELDHSNKHFVVFEISSASIYPIRFKSYDYIRVGSITRNLKDCPEKEELLWTHLKRTGFESAVALSNLSADNVLIKLDYPAYFDLLKLPLPDRSEILERLITDLLIVKEDGNNFAVTNLGAILFAKDLHLFESLRRKAVRVVQYRGTNRIEIERQQEGIKGYATGFLGLIQYINDRVPSNEPIGQALREVVPAFPPIAIRELTANILIHQDFSVSGAGPLIEIFSDRIEFTSPGTPLIGVDRFIDAPPRSRNERLASFMRRVKICEELGSGIDRVVEAAEVFQLPPPNFISAENSTRSILFAPKSVSLMDRNDRIRACYQHAVLQWVINQRMTNASFRKRMGIKDENLAQASRIISDTIEARLIKPADPGSVSRRHAQYIPFWA